MRTLTTPSTRKISGNNGAGNDMVNHSITQHAQEIYV
jgi:hypothetical protein